ncbi:MAG: Spy/CpxP family protein refolding chaperone [Roseateles sp.]|uniref:Spy/CpxP family protein refolding chaperone n=1 Tax=Roseateles sp. TaxID=1971397 RepID=UPI004035FAB8
MNFFRRWHAHHEFRHHFEHGQHFSRHADGFAHLLLSRVGARLDLADEQRRRFAAWVELVQRQRDALTTLARGSQLAALVADERFAREQAQQLLTAKLDAMRAAGSEVIAAFAEFFDSLDDEQRQAMRFMTQRGASGRTSSCAGQNGPRHAPTAAD